MRRVLALATTGLVFLAVLQGAGARPRYTPRTPTGTLRAGVAKADLTWHVGATGGQVANDIREDERDIDPFLHQSVKQPTQGFHDRLSARALVLEDPVTAERFAVVTTDLYLQQNLLHHYVAELLRVQALAAGREPIARENIMISASHNHSAPYFSTISWGVWLFVDKYDDRFTRYAAHQIAQAVERAEERLREVRFGGAVVCADAVQRNIIGPQTANDGTPAGYPANYYDPDLTLFRFDERAPGGGWRPYALWANLGMHPETLGGGGATGLLSADFPVYLATRVERALRAQHGGSPTFLFQQGSVGDAEPDDGRALHDGDACASRGSPRAPYDASHDYWRENFRAIEAMTGPLAARVLDGSEAIESGSGVSPTWSGSTGDPDEGAPLARRIPLGQASRVRMVDFWFSGPLAHPLPTYCNQEVAHWFEGSKPTDCELIGAVTDPLPNLPANQQVADAIRDVAGPDGANLFIPSTGTVQETAGIHLQALAIGDALVATCPCEPTSDMVKNLKTRTDRIARNLWQGYEYPASWSGDGLSWPAGRRQAVVDQIRGQFTGTELGPADGFTIGVMAGQTNDYIGYVVTERQWLARDQYRKELTAFGPTTADYVNTGLLFLARELRARDAGLPAGTVLGVLGAEDHYPAADRAAMDARDLALIAEAEAAYRAWDAAAPPDLDFDQPVAQPPPQIARLDVARFTWNGGSNWTDLPYAVVERCDNAGQACVPFEDQTVGDVVTSLDLPDPGEDPPPLRPWPWTAHWETRLDTPAGLYRFRVRGLARTGPSLVEAYELTSDLFAVGPRAYAITQVSRSDGTVTFRVDGAVPQVVPHAGLVYYRDGDESGHPPCYRCTFRRRPAAGTIVEAAVNGTSATLSGSTWSAPDPGGTLAIWATDAFGNTATATV